MTDWIVLKFGGTSVSSRGNWNNIAGVVARRRAVGARVLIVHSAISGITDRLEKLLETAMVQTPEEALHAIADRHRCLAAELGIPLPLEVEQHLAELREIAAGIGLVREVSDRMRARVMAMGELMATRLGAYFLASQGLPVEWADARTMLRAERLGASTKASMLSASCAFAPDASLQGQLAVLGPVVVTQGFIASDDEGRTVLLGRGGSDTSAAYLAAKLQAQRLEIWTDVPGLFSANPRSTPTARLLRTLHYDEAQEIATSGAKVLHPRCILPAKQYGIPLHVHATQAPDLEGTVLSSQGGDRAQVKAVCTRRGITLISMESPGMWHQVGFLADAFQVFKQHGLSVDLISTSETTVAVSLDPAANTLDGALLDALVRDLSRLCKVEVIGPCASVSLVGRNIRAILHQLAGAFELFEEQKIYLVSQAANDLNFTFVVDEDQGNRLVSQLHELLIGPAKGDSAFGPTWQQLFTAPVVASARPLPWWQEKRAQLLDTLGRRDAAFIYDLAEVRQAARRLRAMSSVSRVHYAMKANSHPRVLAALKDEGIDFECVSRGEIERILDVFPNLDVQRVLYTPNFAPRAEYAWALERGVRVTVDNPYALASWPEIFASRGIFVRVDTGVGLGHHEHVRTAGSRVKFGVPKSGLAALAQRAGDIGTHIVGLHAHIGSGVLDVTSWERTARILAALALDFPGPKVIDIGGGLGVPERTGQIGIDVKQLDSLLMAVRTEFPNIEIWIEPGRYLIAEAGVLLARVTQVKSKGDVRFVGVATGMNSLLRPALYGAYHEIVNLTRWGEPATDLVNVVGPICESADVLGTERLLPPTREGDVLLIANAGAYGRAMSSTYNLRDPAEELFVSEHLVAV